MRPPFFLIEPNGDVTARRTAREAEVAFESQDIDEGECVAAYDADGTILRLRVPVPTRRGNLPGLEWSSGTPVVLELVMPEKRDPDGLRAALIEGLRKRHVDIEPDSTVETLIAKFSISH